jgi:hypothetical protein
LRVVRQLDLARLVRLQSMPAPAILRQERPSRYDPS